MSKNEKIELGLLILFSLGVYLIGIFRIPLMEVDSSGYAAISHEMFTSKEFLEVKNYGQNYLDKPPFLFWSSCVSFFIFGVTDWAYRIPSFLFTLLGLYSTYRLARLFYGERKAWFALLIQVSCLASYLISHDVRTDTILLNAVIFAVWQFMEHFTGTRRLYNLLLGFLGIGIAMLEKGPIGFIVPAFAILTWIYFQRNWIQLVHPKWLLGLLVTAILLIPMCIGLYHQHGWEGIRFYFWTQSFGRITGENSWRNDTDPFFFLHTFLWSFIPWSFLALIALFSRIIQTCRQRLQMDANAVTPAMVFVLTLVGMSFSNYKLPHYIYVVFPFASLVTADWSIDFLTRQKPFSKILYISHYVYFGLLIIAGISMVYLVFPEHHRDLILITIIALLLVAILVISQQNRFTRFMIAGAGVTCVVNLILNLFFYPQLLQFQSGKPAANFLERTHANPESVFMMNVIPNSILFYGKHKFPTIHVNQVDSLVKRYHKIWIYTNENGLESLDLDGQKIAFRQPFVHFPVTMLNMKFLNPATRAEVIKYRYLVRIE